MPLFWPKEKVEGKKSWTEFVVKEDLERMKEYHRLRRAIPDRAPKNYEFRFIDREGRVRRVKHSFEFLGCGVRWLPYG